MASLSDILSGAYSDILSDILSGICSASLTCFRASSLTFYLASFQAFILAHYLNLAAILTFYIAYISMLSGILSAICSDILTGSLSGPGVTDWGGGRR